MKVKNMFCKNIEKWESNSQPLKADKRWESNYGPHRSNPESSPQTGPRQKNLSESVAYKTKPFDSTQTQTNTWGGYHAGEGQKNWD